MIANDFSKYSTFDKPDILNVLFHPRADHSSEPEDPNIDDHLIPVKEDINIGARFYCNDKSYPNVLFFHGNGEIVSDYDDIGSIFNKVNINFYAVDYRGYGKSTGSPTVTSMISDSHIILNYLVDFLENKGFEGPLIIMGRSLGSASAIELAHSYPDKIRGIIIESGFAFVTPLLKLLGVNTDNNQDLYDSIFGHVEKISKIDIPTLIIHAEKDHIIPFSDGEELFSASGSKEKEFCKIPIADHNSIFYYGMDKYIASIRKFLESLH